MTRRTALLVLPALLLTSAVLAFAPGDPDDCGLQFLGSYRAAAKNCAPALPRRCRWTAWVQELTKPGSASQAAARRFGEYGRPRAAVLAARAARGVAGSAAPGAA